MASPVNPPRGMRDFLPAEKARRERVLAKIRGTYREHGFDEIETPVPEDWRRLTSGLGGDNEKLSFGILRRGLEADEVRAAADAPTALADLGLRFDLTVPLARFYASHRSELPPVLRSIQIGPVWRAERPQKGRYRQFVQCDIDVLGEPGVLAEIELITATLAALDALGLHGACIRINDRRLLIGMLNGFGFAPAEHEGALVTIDKLDKIGAEGVVAELRERGAATVAVDALEEFLRRPGTLEDTSFGEPQIRLALPPDPDAEAVAGLAQIGEGVAAARRAAADASGAASASSGAAAASSGAWSHDAPHDVPDPPLRFDPFLVRGMGYYTGPIFEVAHPDVDYSLGGGGRYDGMIGRFSGTDVPAAGFSLGFERLVELVDPPEEESDGGVALVYDPGLPPVRLAALKSAVIATGARVRLVRRTKNVHALLDALRADGFTRFSFVDPHTTADTLGIRPLV
ncbi:MAG: ATP phosphoribosyltransferase regulatory subunit [Micrococcales bacterium]|nr:ATP phosphoribosyltransferase regulatory subunit [Micrococcales bacterium]